MKIFGYEASLTVVKELDMFLKSFEIKLDSLLKEQFPDKYDELVKGERKEYWSFIGENVKSQYVNDYKAVLELYTSALRIMDFYGHLKELIPGQETDKTESKEALVPNVPSKKDYMN